MKRFIIATLVALLVAGGGFALRTPTVKPQKESPQVQPFTYANIVAHFKSAGLHITEVQKRCTIFFEGEWKTRDIYNYGIVMVENSDEDIQLTFYLTDAHEMNWVTEFLDASFFTHPETQALFEMMNSGRDVRDQRIGRFRRVDFHHWKPRHAEILVFSLTPERPGE